MKKLLKTAPFLIGSIFLLLLVTLSFVYSFYLKDIIKPPEAFLYDEAGKIIDKYPFPPSFEHPFGVDRFGRDIFWMVIDGAKYTISIAISVSVLRIIFSLFFGIVYGVYLTKLKFIFESFERAFRFIPSVFICMMFFNSANLLGVTNNYGILVFQIFLLAIVAVPPLTSVIGTEVNRYIQHEFITASRSIGATRFHIIRHHVLPFLKSRSYVLFIQQTVQALILLIHLSIFEMIIGGTFFLTVDIGINIVQSASNEWSGLIGLSYKELMLNEWIVLGPSIAFVLTILAFNLIKRGLEKNILQMAMTASKIVIEREVEKTPHSIDHFEIASTKYKEYKMTSS